MNTLTFERLPMRKAIVVLIAYLGFIITAMPETALGVAWPSMQATFGVPLDALGLLLITSRVGLIFASFNSGRLTTYLGIGLLLMLGSGLRAAALFGYALAPSWTIFLLISLAAGAGGGVIGSGLNTYFAVNHGARLMNWLHASFGLGAMLGPIVMTAILNAGHSWRWGYLIAAVLQVMLTVALLVTLSDWKLEGAAQEETDVERKTESARRNRLWRNSLLWLSMGLFFVSAGIEATAGQWSFSLFTEARSISVAEAGLWVSIYWGSFTLGRILFGFFADRMREATVIRLGMMGAMAGALLLWANLTGISGLFAMALMGLAMAPVAPLLVSSTPRRLGQRDAPTGVGFQVGAASIGIALMPALAGVLAARISLEILPAFLIASCLVFLLLHEATLSRMKSVPDEAQCL